MWKVVSFPSLNELQAFLNTNAIPLAKVAQVFQDNNGHYVLVYTP